MCGIAGLISSQAVDRAIVQRMTDTIIHRGPDDQGLWVDQESRVALGHRRLSIIDLSPLGHQPMQSASSRYVLTYNGEIYNHAQLRAELDESRGSSTGGNDWRGNSDTETLLEALATWGLEQTLERCVGMFAFALWDRRERRLHLVRDRFGEKPLYYGWVGKDFLFASELKSIRSHPKFNNAVDRRALRLYASRNYIPGPHSIYEGIYKLEPGSILTITPEAAARPLKEPPSPAGGGGDPRLKRYWSYADVLRQGAQSSFRNEGEALDQLEQALVAAIKGQSVADVPVGAFLSGGIDSSTVVALYQKYARTPIRTFAIGFEDATLNEAHHAKAVAQHFGTVHEERYVTVREARDVIPLLPSMYDEPFGDASQIPTHLVSRFARDHVKVALSGDGGDELFGGYNRHLAAPKLWAMMQHVPARMRRAVGGALSHVPPQAWTRVLGLLRGGTRPDSGTKVQKAFRVAAGACSLDDVYGSFLDEWSWQPSPVLGHGQPRHPPFSDGDGVRNGSELTRMIYLDAVSYLPDDILCKVDRAAMAVSLETRVPFLDHRVAEVAARMPDDMKVRGGQGKYILRKLLYGQAPRPLFERPKSGFGIPVGEWIRGELRPWAENLLDEKRLAEQGFFNPRIIHRRWKRHLARQEDAGSALWSVLMFQAWLAEGSLS